MLASLRDSTRSLAQADPDIKVAAYAELGITITYHADGRALLESRPRIDDVAEAGVGGATLTLRTCDHWQVWLAAAWVGHATSGKRRNASRMTSLVVMWSQPNQSDDERQPEVLRAKIGKRG